VTEAKNLSKIFSKIKSKIITDAIANDYISAIFKFRSSRIINYVEEGISSVIHSDGFTAGYLCSSGAGGSVLSTANKHNRDSIAR